MSLYGFNGVTVILQVLTSQNPPYLVTCDDDSLLADGHW
jgi:hypothetical protein